MKKICLVLTALLISSSLFSAVKLETGRCTPSREFCVYFTPDDLPVNALHAYLKEAKKSIRLAVYNMNMEGVSEILTEKLNAGVSIEFMADYKLSFESNKTWNALAAHANLTRIRLPVMRGGNPQMHNKIILIDGKTLLIGSANWTYQGLVGNYENVLVTTNATIIRKFSAELDELKNVALVTCSLFGNNCENKSDGWDPSMHNFLTTGSFLETDLAPKKPGVNGCRDLLRGKGLLGAGNQRSFPMAELCMKDERFVKLVDEVSKIEKYIDGVSVVQEPNTNEHRSNQPTPFKVYFSPEDNLQRKMLAEIYSTLDNPKESFVYVTTNFITNRFLATALTRVKSQGVRVRVFFDRNRFEDPGFSFALDLLKDLGFKTATEGTYDDLVTVFDNRISGPFGMNHNKVAIIGNGKSVKLMSGSANWSAGAMSNNDENLLIMEDEALVSIFLKEMVSQLHVYRYGQNLMLPQMQDEISFLTSKSPCLSMHLGLSESCTINNKPWKITPYTSAVITLVDKSIDLEKERAWVKVTAAGKNTIKPLYSYRNFEGSWVTSFPLPLSSKALISFIKAPLGVDPTSNEATYETVSPRELNMPSLAVELLPGHFEWNL